MLVRPPATSCQIVAGSPASASATMLFRVGSPIAASSVLSEVPPTITLKGLSRVTLVKPLPYASPDPRSPLSEKTEILRSAASMNNCWVAI